MKTKFTLLFLLISALSFAQPTLTSNKMLPYGSSFILNYFTDLSAIDTTIQGANKTWDFTGIQATPGGAVLATVINPAQTPYASSFTTSNYGYHYSPSNGYDYYNLSSASFQRTGSWDSTNLTVTYSDPQTEIVFPETLGTSNNDSWDNSASSFGGTYDLVCIGYGTVKLPGGVVYDNTLMIRVTASELTTYNAYFWYSADNGAILTEAIFGDGFFSPQAGLYTTSVVAGINDPVLDAQVNYNNPVSNNLTVAVKSKQNLSTIHYSLINVAGQVIKQGSILSTGTENIFNVDMESESAGIYFLDLSEENGMRVTRPLKLVKI